MSKTTDLNKAAWEEAFDVRVGGFGDDHAKIIRDNPWAFFYPCVREQLEGMRLEGKRVAQLCCNNGRELTSLVHTAHAAYGMGVDIAENIIGQARQITKDVGANCEFICSNVYELSDEHDGEFDLLLTTEGALCWMEDLPAFFRKAHALLKPGGRLLVYDIHPCGDMLAVPEEDCYDPENPMRIAYSYFRKEPFIDNYGMGYVAGKSYESKTFVSFTQTMGDIVTAVAASGLRVDSLTEYDVDIGGNFPALSGKGYPFSYLLLASKA